MTTVLADQQLLELAAKANGYQVKGWVRDRMVFFNPITGSAEETWNPLADDGDALRLAVRLRLSVIQQRTFAGPTPVSAAAGFCRDDFDLTSTPYNGDPFAATRRAIVCAAAEIGKLQP